jgi:hypothetical protein
MSNVFFMHILDRYGAYSMTLKDVPIGGAQTAPTTARSSPRSPVSGAALVLAAAVLAGCNGGSEGGVRRAYELARDPTEPNKNHIERLLADADRDVRAAALVVMEPIDPVRATKMAGVAIDDPDGFVRRAAVAILGAGAASDPALVRRLATHAGGDSDWQVRRQALEAIAVVDDPVVSEAFSRALSDSVRHVRRAALMAAAARPGLLPVDRVCALVADDSDWENRVEAAQILGASKDPAAYPCLDGAIHDPNEFVRAAATAGRTALARAGVVEPPPPAPPAPTTPAEAKPRTGV